jgi:ABC-type transport system involved in multi-copper enzyme maturation permease subunit
VRTGLLELVSQEIGWFLLFPFLIIASIFFWFLIGVLLCVWVFRDAESRGMNGAIWVIIVLLANVIGLLVYLIVREDRRPPATYQPSYTRTTRFCKNCGQQLSSGAKYCSGCGKPVAQQTEARSL